MIKKLIKLFILIVSISIIYSVNAESNPYPKTSSYGTNCTWYTWKITKEKLNISLPNFGNAKDWYKNAKNYRFNVGTTPKAKSIVVWGNWTSYGHVGYVEKITENTLHVWDSTGPCIDENDPEYINCMANGVSEESDKICKANAKKIACKYTISPSDYTITGYIYLDSVPKTSTTTTKRTTTTIKKSNNNNLKNIELSSGIIDFNKETLEYEIEVENNVNKIIVSATLEDNKASINGIGEYELKVGNNEIKLDIVAEDKTKKQYKINVVRKETETKTTANTQIKTQENKKNNIDILNIIISIVLFISFILIYLYKRKQKK